MSKPHSAGGIIVRNVDDKLYVALADQSAPTDGPRGYWSFPKGHVEEGEDALTAAYREIYEESGLTIDDLELVGLLGEYERTSGSPEGKTVLKKITFYHFRTNTETLSPHDDKVVQAAWIPIDDVAATLGNKADADFFESIKQQLQ